VTTLENSAYDSLAEEALVRLDEIKRSQGQKDINGNLKSVIEGTQHFSVPEYLHHFSADNGAAGEYTVGGDDVISITVYEEPDLSIASVRVSMDGYISFPLIGRIKVGGLTTSEIETQITTRLAQGQYLWDAHVAVLVTGYNSKRFLVLGSVKTPGSYSLNGQERVLDAISRAGGVGKGQSGATLSAGRTGKIIRTLNTQASRERKIVIEIDLQGLLHQGDSVSNIFLKDRDVLYIPPAEHFYIIGEVKTPQSYALPRRNLTLVEAISMAGGFTNIAARNRTRVIRVEDGVEKIIEVRVDDITRAGKKGQDVVIKPNDIIVVPLSFF
jgi:polysaccharide biosynthesis/export protein